MMIRLDRTARQAVQLTLMDYTALVRTMDGGPISFPITEFADLAKTERPLVLAILTASPVNRWIDIPTVQLRPDSPFTVTHLEPPPPQSLKALAPALA